MEFYLKNQTPSREPPKRRNWSHVSNRLGPGAVRGIGARWEREGVGGGGGGGGGGFLYGNFDFWLRVGFIMARSYFFTSDAPLGFQGLPSRSSPPGLALSSSSACPIRSLGRLSGLGASCKIGFSRKLVSFWALLSTTHVA